MATRYAPSIAVSVGFRLFNIPKGQRVVTKSKPRHPIHQANLEQLLRVAEGLNQDKLHMDTPVGKAACGTVACLLGWAGTDPYFRKRGLVWATNLGGAELVYNPKRNFEVRTNPELEYHSNSIWEHRQPFHGGSAELFGLRSADSDRLFMVGNHPDWHGNQGSRQLTRIRECGLAKVIGNTLGDTPLANELKDGGTINSANYDLTIHIPKEVIVENVKRVVDGYRPFRYKDRCRPALPGERPNLVVEGHKLVDIERMWG